MKLKNTILKVAFATVLMSSIATYSYAFETYYKKEFNEKILNGVEYLKNIYMTNKGWLTSYAIKVDLSKDYIDVVPVYSKDAEYGKRDTLTNFLKGANYIAGINADFFDMRNATSYPVGTLAENGKLLATSNINEGCNNYSTLFLGKDSPFIDFFDVSMKFYINGELAYNLKHLNKITNFDAPVVLNNPSLIANTSKIDSMYKNLYKIIVQNDKISYISAPGEIVNVPSDGFVVVMKQPNFDAKKAVLTIGQAASLDIKSSVDLNNVKYAISGSVKIIENGQVVNRGVPNTGIHPRTAVGISKDKKHIILVVVDGRNDNSVGLNHDDLATIMLDYGSYDAINFDGGGSTTMAVKKQAETLKVINTVSDGAQRKIINGIGVINNSKVSDTKQMEIKTEGTKFGVNKEITFNIKGYDEYGNISNPDISKIKWQVSGIKGKFTSNGNFVAEEAGKAKFTATYGNIKSDIELEIISIFDKIKLNVDSIVLELNASQKLEVIALDEQGNNLSVDSSRIKWEYSSKTIGAVKSGVFKAGKRSEKGYITVSYLDKKLSVPVIVGAKFEIAKDFNKDNIEVEYEATPSDIVGTAKLGKIRPKGAGKAFELVYQFKKSNSEQIASIRFDDDLVIKDKIKGIGFDIYGDKSNNTVGLIIEDANGKEFNVILAPKISWTGYKNITVNLNEELKYPISIKNIYSSAEKMTKAPKKSAVYFDNLYIKSDSTADIKLPFGNGEIMLNALENKGTEELFNILVLDRFDLYTKDKQREFIKNINASYKAVLNVDSSSAINGSYISAKTQNNGTNKKYDYSNLDVIYLNEASGAMYKFLEDALVKNNEKNYIIVTDQITSEMSTTNNKNLILKTLIDEANAQEKNILIVNKLQKEEKTIGNVKYLPIGLETDNNKAIKIVFKDGNLKYGYVD